MTTPVLAMTIEQIDRACLFSTLPRQAKFHRPTGPINAAPQKRHPEDLPPRLVPANLGRRDSASFLDVDLQR